MKKIALLSMLFSFSALSDVNYCVPHIPKALDPHKILDPIEERIISKVLKTLIPKGDQPGLAKDWKPIEKNVWRVTLNSKIKFNKTLGWKGLGEIGARDVKFSIERQLKNDSKKLSYLPAAQTLAKKLQSMNVVSFREIDFTFKVPVERAEFEKIFSSQVGYIVSEEFHAYKLKKESKDDFFATTGEYTIELATPTLIKLAPVISKNGANDTFYFKLLDPTDATGPRIKENKCHYIFNPSLGLRQSIELTKLRTAKLPLSETRWFLVFKADAGFEKNELLLLHRRLNPDNFKELNAHTKIYNFTGTKKWEWPYIEKVEAKIDSEIDISFCRSNLHYSVNQTIVQSEIKNKISEFTGVTTNYYEVPCEDVAAFVTDIDASGTIMPVTYKKEEEILEKIACNDSSILFCLNPLSKNLNGLDEAAQKHLLIFPLFVQENYFLRIF